MPKRCRWVGARGVDPRGSLVEHRARLLPHALSESRIEQLGAETFDLARDGNDVGAIFEEPSIGREQAAKVVDEGSLEGQRGERGREVMGEAGIAETTVPTAEPTKARQHVATGGARLRERSHRQRSPRACDVPHRHPKIPEPGVLTEHGLARSSDLGLAARVIAPALLILVVQDLESKKPLLGTDRKPLFVGARGLRHVERGIDAELPEEVGDDRA